MIKTIPTITFCLSLLLINNSVYSQKILMSDPIDINNTTNYTLIGHFQNHVLLYRETESKYTIQSFDTKLEEDWSRTIAFNKKNITTIRIIAHEDSFSLLYYFHKIGITFIHIKKFNLQGEETADFEIGRFNSHYYIKDQQSVLSKNKTNIIIYCLANDNQLEIINYNLINQELTWQKDFSLKGFNYYKDFEQILVNNSGEVFVVSNINNTKRKIKQHYFTIYKIDRDMQIKPCTIPFNNYLSTDLTIKFDEKNKQIVMAGLYSTKNTVSNGIFYFHSHLNRPPTLHTSELSETLMRSLTGNKKKKIDGIHNFVICEMILRNDGGVLLVSEQRHIFESSGYFSDDEIQKLQADYLYENALIASIHPSGKIYWKKALYKSQSSENDNAIFSSFFLFKTNSSLRFLYNDNISWGTTIFEYVISNNGDVKRNVVTHQKISTGHLPQLSSSLQLSSHELVTLSERDKKLRVLKITYE
jgi:hypothetical protein